MPPMHAPRLSLVERAAASLRANSEQKETPGDRPPPSGGFRHSQGFEERSQAHLERQGRSNAAGSSRVAERALDDDDDLDEDDGARSTMSKFSHAPSLHPSMRSRAVSEACSTATIGAGDATRYWDYCHRVTEKTDLGHKCRECRLPFSSLGEPLTERRGARVSMRYHAECFSGYADPRSQAGSSHHVGRLKGTQYEAAPAAKAGSKMRSSRHFEHGSDGRQIGGGGGGGGGAKIMNMGGSNGFGARSGRDREAAEEAAPPVPRRPAKEGEITEDALARHLEMQAKIEEEPVGVGELLRRK